MGVIVKGLAPRLSTLLALSFVAASALLSSACGGGEGSKAASPTSVRASVAPSATEVAQPTDTPEAEPSKTATPSQTAATATRLAPMPDTVLPYQVVLSGPDIAHPGDELAYHIRYECVDQSSDCPPMEMEFGWTREAASLIQSSVPGKSNPLPEAQLGWTVAGSGNISVTLKVVASFAGDMTLDVFPPVSHVRYADGSISHKTTTIRS